jgi:putative phosphoribosyl transferase
MTSFQDRRHAGQVLARQVRKYAHLPATCVVALPRGGVPVAYEVARTLNAPLDVFIVRKLGIPGHEDLAMGAIAAGPSTLAKQLINWDAVRAWGITNTTLNTIIGREQRELLRREELYRGTHRGLSLTGQNVILVDDGMASASTMRVAVTALREYQPTRIIVAVPIGDPNTCLEMCQLADESICAVTPNPQHSAGDWYDDFQEPSDTKVEYLLVQARREYQASAHGSLVSADRTFVRAS